MLGSAGLCTAILEGGQRCRATPMRESSLCFFHNPDTQDEAREARRLGGMRRRREGAVAGAYEFDGLGSSVQLRRLLEIAALDALALETSIARGRLLVAVALAGTKLLEVGELEARVEALEVTLRPRIVRNRK